MKKLLRVLLIGLSLLPFGRLQAQEFICDFDFKDFYSIVREVQRGEWLFFNSYYLYTNFHYYKDGSSYETNFSTGYPRMVRDFEILNNRYVFFCADTGLWDYDLAGYYSVVSSHSLVGAFDVNDMFTSSVNLRLFHLQSQILIDTMMQTYKLAVYEGGGGVHVVATGKMNDGTGGIVDIALATATDNSPCLIRVAKSDLVDKELFYDVAVTDNYVVATSYVESSHQSAVRLFPKSNDCTVPIFDGYDDVRYILPFAARQVLVEHINADTFAVVAYVDGMQRIMVSLFDGNSLIGTEQMAVSWSDGVVNVLRDISYSPRLRMLNLLKYYLNGVDTASVVYHLPIPFPPTGTITGHQYNNETLNSIDCSQVYGSHVIASGHHNDSYNQLTLYRLLSNATLGCNEETAIEHKAFDKPVYREPYPLRIVNMEKYSGEEQMPWDQPSYIKCRH